MDLPERLYHGGVPGLMPGDLIEPHEPKYHDGCAACEANKNGQSHPMSPVTQHPEHVYFTSDRLYARHYASKFNLGDAYRVVPIGEATPSTEDRFPTWRAPAVRVTAVIERAVRLTDKDRRQLFNRWTVADYAAAGFTVTTRHAADNAGPRWWG